MEHAAVARLLGVDPAELAPMASRGVAHDHFRLIGRGAVLRVPRAQALQGLPADAALHRQAAAFERAAPSGCVPGLIRRFEPSALLPNGALLVTEIVGRPPRLPDDMPAIAAALAALHVLPLPAERDQAPLPSPPNPLAALCDFVAGRMFLLERAGLPDGLLQDLHGRLGAAANIARRLPPVCALIGVDVHPGNFIMTSDGRAVLTDLERAQYGHPAADLAHAALPTSTRWDPVVAATLTQAATEQFYAAWADKAGAALAEACRPAFAVARVLVWLRTLTWMAHWRREGRASAPAMPAELSAHMDAHAAWALSRQGVDQVGATLRLG